MSDLNTKLEYLEDTKTAIKNAIVEKGVEVSDSDTFRSYAEKISTITSGGSSGETNYLGRIVTEDGVFQFPPENFSFSLPSSVTSIGDYGLYYAFYGCTSLTSTGLNNVTSIGNRGLYYAFYNCTSLTSISFPALNSNSFGSYRDQFYRMLSGVTGCTVHFPSNLESVIGSWSDVTNGFGGTNTTVLFDLPATT